MNYTVFQWINNFAESSKLLDTLMIAITNSLCICSYTIYAYPMVQ